MDPSAVCTALLALSSSLCRCVTDERELEQIAQAVEAVSGRHSSEVLEQELCVDEVRVGQHALDVLQISVVLEGALVQLGALAQLGDLEAV